EGHPGVPLEVDYSFPAGYRYEEFTSDSLYSVLSTENGIFIVVPLAFVDTLHLPVVTIWNEEGDTLYAEPPIVLITGSLPDSIMVPSLPPFPGVMNIPPGLPEDWARNLSFWLVWGSPPPFPWLKLLAAVALAAALVAYMVKRKKNAPATSSDELIVADLPSGKAAEKQALALLESENFIHGRWAELYSEVDLQYRATVAFKFTVVNKALTLAQISRALVSTGKGRKFLEEASPLIREITLQRYADWGSSRERASGFIRRLAKLRGEWSR
ncbi:MAG: hypothetical protein GY852_07215, partial [bacterium]|nr:hypothetical protein [bacterium]